MSEGWCGRGTEEDENKRRGRESTEGTWSGWRQLSMSTWRRSARLRLRIGLVKVPSPEGRTVLPSTTVVLRKTANHHARATCAHSHICHVARVIPAPASHAGDSGAASPNANAHVLPPCACAGRVGKPDFIRTRRPHLYLAGVH